MRKIALIVLVGLLLLLVGCFENISDNGDEMDSGKYITPDYMEEISRELEADSSSLPPSNTTAVSVTVTDALTTVSSDHTTTLCVETIAPDIVTVSPEVVTTAPVGTSVFVEVTTVCPQIVTTPASETTTFPETSYITTAPETTSIAPADSEITLPVVPINGTTTSSSDTTVPEGEVYWVPSGKVWHIRRDCSSLSRSTTILNGSVADAQAAGKERVCKKCG